MIKRTLMMAACLMLAACRPETTGVGITSYNHMKRDHIYTFTVNGAMGPNASPESGGKESCCVAIPNMWRPGLKVKIAWEYDTYQNDRNSPLPPQEAEVEVPRYTKPGTFQVHFYPDNKIKIVVSNCFPGHAFYPMSKEDLLPWEPRETKEAALAAAKRGGRSNDC